ncbi:MAG: formylmethanofuran dehydrogenase subunit C [Planctomycetota bacterium]
MPLLIHSDYAGTIPIEVEGILPEVLQALSLAEIRSLYVLRGRRRYQLGELFEVSGEPSIEVEWSGNLDAVQRIGESMTEGIVRVRGNAGCHVGQSMSGGEILVHGDVGDYAGCRLRGGRLVVLGSAGNHLGGVLAGEKLGMNRGEILVRGRVGKGAGQSMRRGTIVAGGPMGELAGWNMIAGTVIGFSGLGPLAGAGMKRGTIVDASQNAIDLQQQNLLPTFLPGMTQPFPVLRMLHRWLANCSIDNQLVFLRDDVDRLLDPFQLFHGDSLRLDKTGGKGEVFLRNAAAA